MSKLKIGTFNLNNLFERPKVMELEGFSDEGKQVLKDVAELNELLEKDSYIGQTGTEIIRLLTKYFLDDNTNEFIQLNEIREKLFSRKRDGTGLELRVNGRNEWLGWIELIKKTTNEISLENTARVIEAVAADLLCTVEVDSRIALNRFNDLLLKNHGGAYPHVMVVDGNDDRGIDVGLLSKYPIRSIKSHVDDSYKDSQQRFQKIFSRDCPEYEVVINDTTTVYMLCNHFKSKGYGSQSQSNAKRKKQAKRVTEILDLYDLTTDFVVVAGDFNDTPDSAPLTPLITYPGLHDVLNSPRFTGGARSTYHTGNDQIDFLLVSTPLFDRISDVKIERRGFFKRNNPSFPTVTSKITQASDHAAVWAEFTL